MEKLYLINELSEITGVSKDTIRYYDKIGLLKPRRIDDATKYRFYSYEQFWILDVISCLRNLDVPIEKIKEILESRTNEKTIQVLKECQQEAKRLAKFYKNVDKDIEWYSNLVTREEEEITGEIVIKELPERNVLFAQNSENLADYHLNLQKLNRSTYEGSHSIRRTYGWELDIDGIGKNQFIKKGEYVFFEKKEFEKISRKHLMQIPAGKYACTRVMTKSGHADFSKLYNWVKENNVKMEFVIAEEIGLSLFTYDDLQYPCEVRVLLEKTAEE